MLDLKIAPTASYGFDVIWDKLTHANLETMNKVKSTYLRRVLGLHPATPAGYAFLLAGSPLFIEDLIHRHELPITVVYKNWIRDWEDKMAEVDPLFLDTNAMRTDAWKGSNRQTRHLVTRFSVHGFHHQVCSTEGYHEPNSTCRCALCSSTAPNSTRVNEKW